MMPVMIVDSVSLATSSFKVHSSIESVPVCVCVFTTAERLQDLLQSCARGGRRIVEDMCYEIRRAEACVD